MELNMNNYRKQVPVFTVYRYIYINFHRPTWLLLILSVLSRLQLNKTHIVWNQTMTIYMPKQYTLFVHLHYPLNLGNPIISNPQNHKKKSSYHPQVLHGRFIAARVSHMRCNSIFPPFSWVSPPSGFQEVLALPCAVVSHHHTHSDVANAQMP